MKEKKKDQKTEIIKPKAKDPKDKIAKRNTEMPKKYNASDGVRLNKPSNENHIIMTNRGISWKKSMARIRECLKAYKEINRKHSLNKDVFSFTKMPENYKIIGTARPKHLHLGSTFNHIQGHPSGKVFTSPRNILNAPCKCSLCCKPDTDPVSSLSISSKHKLTKGSTKSDEPTPIPDQSITTSTTDLIQNKTHILRPQTTY
ncbi:hypothetical protein J3Q64DRAFT_1460547 [Phycomyces blakesleeanus]|uniref:Uncharacterized protein n=1 Tax=Phycomyces blakesleeanus TaxID=4837 RepID=A0ABR3B2G2_PHYBL